MRPSSSCTGLPKDATRVGAAALGVGAVAGGAAQFGEQLLPVDGQSGPVACRRSARPRTAPVPCTTTVADHAGVLRAAIFGAEQVIGAGLGGVEPCVV